jgi:tetratricopeptide (TPR) repeat protein
VTSDFLQQARERYDAGDFRQAREAAMQGLAQSADDADLLGVAGRAGVELGEPDAVDQLKKVTELRGDDAAAWRDLGDALATEGRTDEANDAFAKAVELDPEDDSALTSLGHTAYAAGRGDEAVSHLEKAADRSRGSSAHISLVDMHRMLGRYDDALVQAERLAEAAPDDLLAALDVGELRVEVGRLDDALEAFGQVRELADLPEHEVCALHGMIAVELKRDNADRALELAREAASIDPHGRTRQVLSFLGADDASEGEEVPEPAPSREELDQALAASLFELRRFHGEHRTALGGQIG